MSRLCFNYLILSNCGVWLPSSGQKSIACSFKYSSLFLHHMIKSIILFTYCIYIFTLYLLYLSGAVVTYSVRQNIYTFHPSVIRHLIWKIKVSPTRTKGFYPNVKKKKKKLSWNNFTVYF